MRYLVASMEVEYAFGAASKDVKLMPVELQFEVKDKEARMRMKLRSIANDQLRGRGWLKLKEAGGKGRRREVELHLASWPVLPLLYTYLHQNT